MLLLTRKITILTLKTSVYCQNDDVILPDPARHMPMVYDIVKRMLPSVKRLTTVCTICEAMNSSSVCKEMVPSVHNLLRLYLTVPVTSATSERTFSALKYVLTSLRSSVTEKRLNNCLIPYIHKDLTDALDIKSQAEEFASRNQERIKYFGKWCNIRNKQSGIQKFLVQFGPPPPPILQKLPPPVYKWAMPMSISAQA